MAPAPGYRAIQWAKNDERPELFRVQDARAALPQNCSGRKIERLVLSAYGTSVPYAA